MDGERPLLDELGQHEEAISYYDKALGIDPNNIYALYNKGLALDNLGRTRKLLVTMIKYWI